MGGSTFHSTMESIFNEEIKPIYKIYADMEYLQDLRFGALLKTVKNKVEMQYIYQKLSVYNTRTDFEVCKYFPVLKRQEAQIDAMIADQNFLSVLGMESPFTSTYDALIRLLVTIQHHNKLVGSDDARMTLTVNTSTPGYPAELLALFADNTKQYVGELDIVHTSTQPYADTPASYQQHDVLFIKDIEAFINKNQALTEAFVAKGEFMDNHIISHPYINKSLDIVEEEYEMVLQHTQAQLGIYCEFGYLPSQITINK